MNLKKLAVGLLFGSLSMGAVACGGDDSSTGTATGSATGTATGTTTGTVTGTVTGTTTGTTPTDLGVVCNQAAYDADTDTGTKTITITHMSIPAADGFNLDGINNASAPAGMGATIPGCGKQDITGGIDNALGTVAQGLTGTLDLNAAIAGLIQRTVADGGTEGSLILTVVANKIPTDNAVVNDPCLGLTATLDLTNTPGVDATVNGFGSMSNNVVNAVFDSALLFNISLDGVIPSSVCIGGVCNPATLSLMVRGARARATLSADHNTITSGVIGGYVFYEDAAAGYATANQTGFVQSFTDFAVAANLDGSDQTPPTGTTDLGLSVFSGARDLHMAVDGSLTPCTGSSAQATDKNTVSVGLAIDSMP